MMAEMRKIQAERRERAAKKEKEEQDAAPAAQNAPQAENDTAKRDPPLLGMGAARTRLSQTKKNSKSSESEPEQEWSDDDEPAGPATNTRGANKAEEKDAGGDDKAKEKDAGGDDKAKEKDAGPANNTRSKANEAKENDAGGDDSVTAMMRRSLKKGGKYKMSTPASRASKPPTPVAAPDRRRRSPSPIRETAAERELREQMERRGIRKVNNKFMIEF